MSGMKTDENLYTVAQNVVFLLIVGLTDLAVGHRIINLTLERTIFTCLLCVQKRK